MKIVFYIYLALLFVFTVVAIGMWGAWVEGSYADSGSVALVAASSLLSLSVSMALAYRSTKD